jgi:hypothetical protein
LKIAVPTTKSFAKRSKEQKRIKEISPWLFYSFDLLAKPIGVPAYLAFVVI